MGFRFRKSIKLAPGIRLNLSKSGISTSLGPRGATVNVGGKRSPRVTVGVPGTGLSYSQRIGAPADQAHVGAGATGGQGSGRGVLIVALVLVAFGFGLYALMQ
jgi:hypothetical protein